MPPPAAVEAPIEQAMKAMLGKLPAEGIMHVATMIKGWQDAKFALSLGSACSGSDIATIVCRVLAHQVQLSWGHELLLDHVFACEIDDDKRAWLRKQYPSLRNMFKDVSVFDATHAECEIEGLYVCYTTSCFQHCIVDARCGHVWDLWGPVCGFRTRKYVPALPPLPCTP